MSNPGGDTSLRISLIHIDGYAEMALIGELDASSVADVSMCLERVIADGHRDVRLNLSALTFLDAAGTGCLVASQRNLTALGGRLRLIAASGIPLTVLTICGLLDTFDVNSRDGHPSTRGEEDR